MLLYSKFLWLISTFIFWCSCNFLWCIFYLVIHVQYHTMCALTVLRCTCTYINWSMRTHNASSCRAFCIRAQEHLRLITISDYLPEPHFRVESKDTADICWVLQLSLSKSSVRGNNFEMWSAQKGATEISNHEQIGCDDGRVCPKSWQWLGSRGMAGTRVWWWDSHLT